MKARREAGNWKEDAPIFKSTRRDFRRILKAAKVQHVTHHDLRRRCISNWARRLLPPVVQKLAGHKDIRTTTKFHVSVRHDRSGEGPRGSGGSVASAGACDLLRDAIWTQT
ncbi:MAG: tyrosine-type recombinase/integrase [Phycisphaerales bacterium]|nr:MAG: tyrosine-type recombinase/integrase [Phycisphaerales bacterium]